MYKQGGNSYDWELIFPKLRSMPGASSIYSHNNIQTVRFPALQTIGSFSLTLVNRMVTAAFPALQGYAFCFTCYDRYNLFYRFMIEIILFVMNSLLLSHPSYLSFLWWKICVGNVSSLIITSTRIQLVDLGHVQNVGNLDLQLLGSVSTSVQLLAPDLQSSVTMRVGISWLNVVDFPSLRTVDYLSFDVSLAIVLPAFLVACFANKFSPFFYAPK
jgi:hypothetical protein